MKHFIKFIMVLACLGLFVGCATNRSVVSLDISGAAIKSPANGKQVLIQTVVDKRQFEENPKTQDIPSLGFGGATQATNDLKKRAIGRKRNGYGKALGDILLQEGETVETVVNDSITRAFEEMGYEVISSSDTVTNSTIVIDAVIEKFWAYMTPGFWAITLTSDISTDMTLTYNDNGEKKEERINVTSDGKYQVATESNWMEIVKQSLDKYIEQLKMIFSEKL